MRRAVLICTLLLVCSGRAAAGAESILTVKALYAAAAYEDALTAVTETRPVPLKQDFPAWNPTDSTTRRSSYTGSVRVHVEPDGRVSSATIVRGVHATYDAALLRAARNWMYEPARRNGVPIGVDLTIEVNLQPPQ